jgi:hypothetical protein
MKLRQPQKSHKIPMKNIPEAGYVVNAHNLKAEAGKQGVKGSLGYTEGSRPAWNT